MNAPTTLRTPPRLGQQYDAVAPDYARLIAPRYAPIAALVDEAVGSVRPSLAVVEIAAGTGALTRLLAPRVLSTGGSYTALDISSGMLREAAPTVDPRVELLLADCEDSGLATASTDLVVSSLGVVQDTEAGWAEARRLVRPGGRVVLTMWGADYAERDVIQQARRLLGGDPLPPAPVDDAVALALTAGFGVVHRREVRLPVVHDSLDAYLRYRSAFGTPPWVAPERVDAALEALAAASRPYLDAAGRVVLDWTVAVLEASPS